MSDDVQVTTDGRPGKGMAHPRPAATAPTPPRALSRVGARTAAPLRAALEWLGAERSRWLTVLAFAVFVVLALAAPLIAPYGPFDAVRDEGGQVLRNLAPSPRHLFGTTSYGNDVFSQVVWGTRRALAVGGVAAAVAVVIGVNVGLVAGYRGGWVDSLLMRLTDTAFALPFLPLAIVLIGLFGRSDTVLLLVIGCLFWRTTARVVRAQVLTVKERTYVAAAKVAGAGRRRILFRHIAPNVYGVATLYGILLVAEAVLAEAMLSFLGLAPTSSISWGTIMNASFSSGQMRETWWWTFFPGLFIMLFVLTVSLLGRAYEKAQRAHRGER